MKDFSCHELFFVCTTLQLIRNASPKAIIYACCMLYGISRYRVRGTDKKSNGILSSSESQRVWSNGVFAVLILVYHICNTIQFENWLKYIIHQLNYLLFAVWWFRDSSLTLSASAYLWTVYLWHWKWTRQISVSIDVFGCNKIDCTFNTISTECMHMREPILISHCFFMYIIHKMQCIILRLVAYTVYSIHSLDVTPNL